MLLKPYLHMSTIQIERSDHSDRDRHIADNIFTAGAHHLFVVIVLIWQLLQCTFQLSILPIYFPPHSDTSTWIPESLLKMGSLDLFLFNQLYDF